MGELPTSSRPFAKLQNGRVSLYSSICENSLGIFVENKLKMSRQRNVVSTKHIFISDCECKSGIGLRDAISHSDLCWQGYSWSFLSTWEPPGTVYSTFTEGISIDMGEQRKRKGIYKGLSSNYSSGKAII